MIRTPMTAVAPFLTFPGICWWMHAARMNTLVLDSAEHYQKMTGRNRYTIPGANNPVLLSVPLTNGRNQHVPMKEVRIHNESNWQVQHWRTLVSVYRRSPYFEHYEPMLQPLYQQTYEYLTDFNKAGMAWVIRQMKLKITIEETGVFLKEYPADISDLRSTKSISGTPLPEYYQVFQDRTGFVPNMSILDLLFSEGPMASQLLTG